MRRILRPIEGFSTTGDLIDAVSRFGKTVKLKADRYYSDIKLSSNTLKGGEPST